MDFTGRTRSVTFGPKAMRLFRRAGKHPGGLQPYALHVYCMSLHAHLQHATRPRFVLAFHKDNPSAALMLAVLLHASSAEPGLRPVRPDCTLTATYAEQQGEPI